jgi:hypothetical protein
MLMILSISKFIPLWAWTLWINKTVCSVAHDDNDDDDNNDNSTNDY